MPDELTISIAEDGTVGVLHVDGLELHTLGRVRSRRASHVEWDDGAQAHVATLVDGTEAGRSPVRADVLAAEARLLDGRIADGTVEALWAGGAA